MREPHPHIWDSSYEPTHAELEEPVQLEGAHDYTPEQVAERILGFTPPADATWPDES